MNHSEIAKAIAEGRTNRPGIELGSTRIMAVLIDEDHNSIASGSHEWEKPLRRRFWTYHLEDV
jgi:sugar (pentulose or hexulose) kinase